MDSLTQVALGAAVGEAVLGRKMGHRAMLWGAIGGTIPDLDVTANVFLSEVDALAFHRSITHSFLFAAVFPIPLALGLQWLYNGAVYHIKRFREASWWIASFVFLLLFLSPALVQLRMGNAPSWWWYVVPLVLAVGLSALLRRSYVQKSPPDIHLSFGASYTLFFLTFLTHILLDATTTYGTQLFIPFSRERIAWDFISVIDPLYTLPLMIPLVIILFLKRNHPWRWKWNDLGLAISTAYLAFCAWHHHRVLEIAEHSLRSESIAYERLKATPTLANNVLWNVMADVGDKIYVGSYSFLDSRDTIADFEAVDKGLHYLDGKWRGRTTDVLRWFSDGYFRVRPVEDGLMYHDLRFGVKLEGFDRQAFGFHLTYKKGRVMMDEDRDPDVDIKAYLNAYRDRMMGREIPDDPVNPVRH